MIADLLTISTAMMFRPIKAAVIGGQLKFRSSQDERCYVTAIKAAIESNEDFEAWVSRGEILITPIAGDSAPKQLGLGKPSIPQATRTLVHLDTVLAMLVDHPDGVRQEIESFDFDRQVRKESFFKQTGEVVTADAIHTIERLGLSLPDDQLVEDLEGEIIDAEFSEVETEPVVVETEPVVKPAEPPLSEEQEEAVQCALRQIEEGATITYITGKAGTGKSTILRELRRRCKEEPIVLAYTGLAAMNVSGQTINSFFSFAPGPIWGGKAKGLSRIKAQMFQKLDNRPIVIDEVGMVRADMLDGIDKTLRRTPGLEEKKPFGGVPIVLIGDPYQLEPIVGRGGEEDFMKRNYKSPFFFDANVFGGGDPLHPPAKVEMRELSQVFRQSGDDEFVDHLNRIRKGDASVLPFFDQFVREPLPETTHIYFKNEPSKRHNLLMLSQLDGEERVFDCSVEGELRQSDYPGEEKLRLKVGCEVMVIKNLYNPGSFIANGTRGTVTRFGIDQPTPIWKNGMVVMENRSGVYVEVDGEEVFIFDQNWEKVKFEFDQEKNDVKEVIVGKFTQLPLRLAWAITVHKSQGMTLPAAHIGLDDIAFSHGQLYVALSRVKSRDGLSLGRKLSPKDLIINSAVSGFDLIGGGA